MKVVDPRGPILNAGMAVAVDSGRVEARGYRFDPKACRKPDSWKASWIWLSGDERPLVALFRKEVTFSETPREVRAWMSADTTYRLYINGHPASRGPADIGTDYPGGDDISTGHWLYDYRDLAPWFHKGANEVAFEVFTEPLTGSPVSKGRPGLLFEAQAEFPYGPTQSLGTDTTWRGAAGEQLTPGPGGWQWDARKEPVGWRLPGFDDSAWLKCHAIESIWTPLDASEIPPLMEARYPTLGPHTATLQQDGEFTVHFDRIFAGYVTIKAGGPAGSELQIIPSELPGRPSRQMRLILGEGTTYFEYPFLDGFSMITVRAAKAAGPIQVDLGANFASQPVDYKGSFECSDPELNRLWDVSRWVTQICLQTHHLDSPNHQEPISDPGDYLIEDLVSYLALGSHWLARQDLRKFAQVLRRRSYRTFHTSYALLWLHILLDYYDYTGDKELLQELAPTADGLLDTFMGYIGGNGLVSEAPNYMFMDWVEIEGFNCHHPPAVIGQGYITALFAQALEDGARLHELLGRAESSLRKRRRDIIEAFNRELWNPNEGLYRDGKPGQTHVPPNQWLPADKPVETFSTQVNALAVLCGVAPKNRQPGILDRLMARKDLNTQPYFMHFVLSALAVGGRFERYGLDQIRRWQIVPETQSFREMWHDGDYCHGWGATPLIQLTNEVLGVKPLSPGFGKVLIRPLPCDLDWARGVVPTPHGPIKVSWKKTDGRVRLVVDVPRGMEADVTLGSRKVTVGGGKHILVATSAN